MSRIFQHQTPGTSDGSSLDEAFWRRPNSYADIPIAPRARRYGGGADRQSVVLEQSVFPAFSPQCKK
jgi:hypothetical protein